MKRRGKNLSEHDVTAIVGILERWTGKLTWPALCDSIALRTRQHYTRQALFAHTRIAEAFAVRKQTISQTLGDEPTHLEQDDSDPLAQLRAENERLKKEVARLDKQLNDLRDQFAVWAYNSYAKGLTEEDLWRPLPGVDRDRTDELEARREAKRKRTSIGT